MPLSFNRSRISCTKIPLSPLCFERLAPTWRCDSGLAPLRGCVADGGSQQHQKSGNSSNNTSLTNFGRKGQKGVKTVFDVARLDNRSKTSAYSEAAVPLSFYHSRISCTLAINFFFLGMCKVVVCLYGDQILAY